ncbi:MULTISPECIES: GNAT family N-acetyltransferase [unclassified Pseudomonas]|uniref:GNAT family N-acetyltransferase n=1 Tax=unclassified Pseudomonas TaxID=196821 RepID=UPI002004AADB|nr:MULTISPECIES: GNAT family N-acetyltransferase [unclassified Pseudomonas]MCK6190560.1 GNAT family N-acetyltransferase [Pseudomonas sp. EYE_354]WLH66462.1 GNAT family N-acetyltransferase [Pseudomonas sp. FP2309]
MQERHPLSDLYDDGVSIRPLIDLPQAVRALEAQAISEGFGFLTRLITEWDNHTNRFSRPGECLLGVFYQDQLVAIGGITQDPHAGPTVGRLRRVYVATHVRRRRLGRTLVQALLDHAALKFEEVRLFTDTPEAAAFYRRCGFQPISDGTATHVKSLSLANAACASS